MQATLLFDTQILSAEGGWYVPLSFGNGHRSATLVKLAKAMGVFVDQLKD